MTDISELMEYWIRCCSDLWSRWFVERPQGADEFIEIEGRLIDVLVIDQLQAQGVLNRDQLFARMRVQYKKEVNGIRQVCRQQSAGNVFGKAQVVLVPRDSIHDVRGIDPVGTMDGIGPYVEVVWEEGFILEPTDNLKFLIAEDSGLSAQDN
jgi:hypothetical protein